MSIEYSTYDKQLIENLRTKSCGFRATAADRIEELLCYLQTVKKERDEVEQELSHIRGKGCDFCNTFDFASVKAFTGGIHPYLGLAVASTKFPKEEQFKFCPECGRKVR